MTQALSSRENLLRWWRTEQTDLGLETVARSVGVFSPTTIHNWETGRTEGPSLAQLRAMDSRYGAGRALEGLYAAIRTPAALQPARKWWCNFQGPSGPCWAWLRVAGDEPAVGRVDAGPFAVDIEVPPGVGIFLQAYAFTDNPPVHATLDIPGWVDFGYGVLPPEIGARVIDAAQYVVISSHGPALMTATSMWLPGKFGSRERWFEELRGRLGHRVESARHVLLSSLKAPIGTRSDVSRSYASRDEVPRHWDGVRFEALRRARGLSLSDLAGAATELDESLPRVSRDHIHRFEHGSTPRVPQLVERLDMALGADGRSCAIRTSATRVSSTVTEVVFPSYWIGPVWVQFFAVAPIEDARARLIWKPWHKGLILRDGVVVTTRKSTRDQQALRVEAPEGWNVVAGVGVHPRAVDVNDGWGLVTPEAAFETLAHYYKVLEQALRHTVETPEQRSSRD